MYPLLGCLKAYLSHRNSRSVQDREAYLREKALRPDIRLGNDNTRTSRQPLPSAAFCIPVSDATTLKLRHARITFPSHSFVTAQKEKKKQEKKRDAWRDGSRRESTRPGNLPALGRNREVLWRERPRLMARRLGAGWVGADGGAEEGFGVGVRVRNEGAVFGPRAKIQPPSGR